MPNNDDDVTSTYKRTMARWQKEKEKIDTMRVLVAFFGDHL